MTFVVLSDICGNANALSAVLDVLDRRCIKQSAILSIGTTIGHGVAAERCGQLLFDCGAKILLSIDDQRVLDPHCDLSQLYSSGIATIMMYNRSAVSNGIFRKISRLEDNAIVGGYAIKGMIDVDGRQVQTKADVEAIGVSTVLRSVGRLSDRIVLTGGHVPWTCSSDGLSIVSGPSTKSLAANPVILGAGSVGLPKDRNPAACAMIVDEGRAEWIRVPYCHEATITEMKESLRYERSQYERLRLGV